MNSRRASIIYNPMSGRKARRADEVRSMIRLLGERGIVAKARATAQPEDATGFAREAVAAGVDIVIGYGGDGTLNELIQGIAGSRTLLGVWPGGTSNVVARDLGVPFENGQLADMFAGSKTKRIALGLAKRGAEPSLDPGTGTANSKQAMNERYFVMMAGIGLDASVARGVNKKLKRRTGEFAYWVSGIKHLFMWRGEPFTIEVDGKSYESTFALIGNGKGYGGGMMITPGAKLEDPWFEVYVLPPLSSRFAYLRALRGCMRGKPEVSGG
jgi:YegS/Rv2252/BmrU family lipid kinase